MWSPKLVRFGPSDDFVSVFGVLTFALTFVPPLSLPSLSLARLLIVIRHTGTSIIHATFGFGFIISLPLESLNWLKQIQAQSISHQIPAPPQVNSLIRPVLVLPVIKWSTPKIPKNTEIR